MNRAEEMRKTSPEQFSYPLALVVVATTVTGVCAQYRHFSLTDAELLASGAGIVTYLNRKRIMRWLDLTSKAPQWLTHLVPDTGFGALGYGTLAFASVVFLSSISPKLQAAVLNDRLERILVSPSKNSDAVTAEKLLKTARSASVRLKPELVSQVITRTSADDNQDWETYVAAVNYKLTVGAGFPYVAASEKRETVLDPPTPNDTLAHVRITGPFRIIYRGTPMTLEDVAFKNCMFDVSENENSKLLLEAVLNANGEPFSLTLR